MVAPLAEVPSDDLGDPLPDAEPRIRSRRLSWARLLMRVLNIDVLTCAKCGSKRKIIAFIVFEDDFAVGTRDVDGILTLTEIAGQTLTYAMTTGEDPLIVTDDLGKGTEHDVLFTGHIKLDFLDTAWKLWGSGTETNGGKAHGLVLGGTTPGSVSGSTPPINALGWDLPRRSCDCPQSGVLFFETKVHVDEVVFDLDKFQKDTEDDFPSYTFPVSVDATGAATVTFTGCGTFSSDFTADFDVTVNASKTDLRARLDTLCNAGELSQTVCTLVKGGLQLLKSKVSIEVKDGQLDDILDGDLRARFDKGICG